MDGGEGRGTADGGWPAKRAKPPHQHYREQDPHILAREQIALGEVPFDGSLGGAGACA